MSAPKLGQELGHPRAGADDDELGGQIVDARVGDPLDGAVPEDGHARHPRLRDELGDHRT
jgi:hypothetical protein